MLNKSNALTGALVADAAALGLHWLYDQEQIARLEATGSILFRQPDANVYVDVMGYFAHGGRMAGQLSHYGESAHLVGRVCASGAYSVERHREQFLCAFGPCGTFSGYADRPTKALIAKLLIDADDVQHPSGIDDDQTPGLCPVAAIFAHGLEQQIALEAVQVISTNTDVLEATEILYGCLEKLMLGVSLKDALTQAAGDGSTHLRKLLCDALALNSYRPLEAATQFGLACHVPQGLPLIWHLLWHADSFESVVRDNIRCGGDSCGRSMVLGALAGVAFGVPQSLLERMSPNGLDTVC